MYVNFEQTYQQNMVPNKVLKLTNNWNTFINFRKNNYYTVRVGDYDRALNEHNEQEIRVKRAIKHPLYYIPYALNNDIALLELEKPAIFNDRVGIACLPSVNAELPVNDPNTRCYITGEWLNIFDYLFRGHWFTLGEGKWF